MTQPISSSTNVSKTAKRLFWGAIGCIAVCIVILFVPSATLFLNTTNAGKTILFYIQLGIFFSSIVAIIFVFSLFAEVNPNFKIRRIKLKLFGQEVEFGDKSGNMTLVDNNDGDTGNNNAGNATG